MRFRGLHTERHDVDASRAGMRREAIVQTFFARQLASGVGTDARPFWALMAYAHGGQAAVERAVSALPSAGK